MIRIVPHFQPGPRMPQPHAAELVGFVPQAFWGGLTIAITGGMLAAVLTVLIDLSFQVIHAGCPLLDWLRELIYVGPDLKNQSDDPFRVART